MLRSADNDPMGVDVFCDLLSNSPIIQLPFSRILSFTFKRKLEIYRKNFIHYVAT